MKKLVRVRVAVLVGVLVLVSTATAAVAPEVRRRAANSQRIALMHPYMRPKVGAILADMERHGDKPVIDAAVWRTASEQARLVRMGRSTVLYSFHNVTGAGGRPESLAADIPDYYKGYSAGNGYWLRLYSSARGHGLTTGVLWGVSGENRNRIVSLAGRGAWSNSYKRGWDPSHVEVVGISLAEARKGVRPR